MEKMKFLPISVLNIYCYVMKHSITQIIYYHTIQFCVSSRFLVGFLTWLWKDVGWGCSLAWAGYLDGALTWSVVDADCWLRPWVPPPENRYMAPPTSWQVGSKKDCPKSECPKGITWNLAKYGLHSELAKGYLYSVGQYPRAHPEAGGWRNSWWGLSGSPCRRACEVGDTVAAFFGKYIPSQDFKMKIGYKIPLK